jgi:putative oxidoreductase
MANASPNGPLSQWAPFVLSFVRIAAAAVFVTAGTMKLFAFPAGMPPNGGTAALFSQIWIGGFLEVAGGALLVLGLFTRPVAFLLSGEMAVAYFQFHAPGGFWPTQNGGVPAILYCLLWLYVAAEGGGPASLDELLRSKRNR